MGKGLPGKLSGRSFAAMAFCQAELPPIPIARTKSALQMASSHGFWWNERQQHRFLARSEIVVTLSTVVGTLFTAGESDARVPMMRYAAFALAITMAGPAHAADPDFSTSTSAYEPVPAIAGDVIRYTVAIINTGGDSTYSRIVTTLPRGYFIRAYGDCAGQSLNREDRRLVWHEGAFTGGSVRHCRIDLLSRRESAGTMAPLVTEITTPPAGYFRTETGPELSTPADPRAIRIGTMGISQAGLASIAFLLAAVIGAAVIRMAMRKNAKLRPALGAWFMITLGAGFLLFFLSLARDDIRSYRDYRETTCFVFDSAIRTFPGSGKHSASTYEPLVAVRYDALGVETYATAYPPATALSFGWLGFSQQTLERFHVGSVHPCWFDPNDVRMVMLERGPGAAYFLALLPLMALAFGALKLFAAIRGLQE